jgi:hypothetical protein
MWDGGQESLGTHLFYRSLACGGRHAAEPRQDTGASSGHIRGGVRGVLGLQDPLLLSD